MAGLAGRQETGTDFLFAKPVGQETGTDFSFAEPAGQETGTDFFSRPAAQAYSNT